MTSRRNRPTIDDPNYLLNVARGLYPGHSIVTKFGENEGVPNGSWEAISSLSTALPWLTAATTVRIKAGGNAADTLAGAGAQKIVVQGLANDLTLAQEEIDTNGISASTSTTTSFIRLFRAWVSQCGTYATPTNTAAITIENTAGDTDLLIIPAAQAQSQHAAYSVPTGHTAYLLAFEFHIESTKPADVRLCWRADLSNTTTISASRVIFEEHGIDGDSQNVPPVAMNAIPGESDIWMEANGGGAATSVSGAFQLLQIQD